MRPFLLAIPLLLLLGGCGSGGQAEDAGRLTAPGVYIALGDSLSEGVGASDPGVTGFVPRVHRGLGEGFELVNLGESGDTSSDLLNHGHLERAVTEIGQRNSDDDQENDVKLVTLELGGNDLLDVFFSLVLTSTCPALEQSLAKPECVDALQEILDEFAPNLATALDRLGEADPELTIVVMTLYDPFSGGLETLSELAQLALEGRPDTPFPEGLNDIIRGEAAERDLILVDWYPLFKGKANEYIARDFIHPNDSGYEVMAEAILEAVH